MRLCNNTCKTLIQCIKCGRQLCKLVDEQNPDTVVQQKCSSEGFYNLEEGKVCIQCHSASTVHYGPSQRDEKHSSS